MFWALPEGVVFDSGDGVSHSVPVFDGHCLPHAVQRFPLAGVDVTLHLIKVFVKLHLPFIDLVAFLNLMRIKGHNALQF